MESRERASCVVGCRRRASSRGARAWARMMTPTTTRWTTTTASPTVGTRVGRSSRSVGVVHRASASAFIARAWGGGVDGVVGEGDASSRWRSSLAAAAAAAGRRRRRAGTTTTTRTNAWFDDGRGREESGGGGDDDASADDERRASTSRRAAGWTVAAETSGAYGEAARGGGRGTRGNGGRGGGRGRGDGGRREASSRNRPGDDGGGGAGGGSARSKRKKSPSGGGAGGGNGGAEREYIQINSTITKLQTVDELLDYASERVDEMNVINLATCMHRLGRLKTRHRGEGGGAARDGETHPAVVEDARFQTLTNKLRELLLAAQDGTLEEKGLGTFKVRPLSAICWGAAHCGLTTSSGDPMLSLVFKNIITLEEDSPPGQNVSNLLWAYASMHNSRETNKELMKKLEYWCECIMDDFAAQGVSNSLWAFATLGHTLRPEVVSLFSKAIKKNMKDFKSMEFSNVVWAIATMKLELDPPDLFDDILRECHANIKEYPNLWSSQSVSNILWSMATHPQKMRPQHDEFLKTLVQFVERKAHTFICQGLSNTLWAYATLEFVPSFKMLELVTRSWENLLGDITISDSTNLLWSYSSLRFNPGSSVLNKVAQLYVDATARDVSATGVSNSLWAWANFDWTPKNPEIMHIVLSIATEHFRDDPELQTQSLSNVLWALAILRWIPDDEFLTVFQDRTLVELRKGAFSHQGLTNTIWAFAQLGIKPNETLMRELTNELGEKVSEFTSAQAVSNSLLALASFEYWPDEWIVEAYRAKIVELYREDAIPDIDWAQLFQANAMFENYSPRGAMLTDPNMVELATKAWKVGTSRVVISQFHREVSAALTNMGVPHEIEYVTEDGLFSLDIVLRGKKVAIEVDGPSHFARNFPRRRLSGEETDTTNSRYRYLEKAGWTTVHVPWFEWASVNGSSGQSATFLAKKLFDQAGLTVMDVASDDDMSDSGMNSLKTRGITDTDMSRDGSRIVINQREEDPLMRASSGRREMKPVFGSTRAQQRPNIQRTGYGMMAETNDPVASARSTPVPSKAPRASRARRVASTPPPRAPSSASSKPSTSTSAASDDTDTDATTTSTTASSSSSSSPPPPRGAAVRRRRASVARRRAPRRADADADADADASSPS